MENEPGTENKFRNILGYIKARTWIKTLLSIFLGVLAGYLYFYFVGCKSGTCPITSNPLNSMLAGGLMGFVLTFGNSDDKKKDDGREEQL